MDGVTSKAGIPCRTEDGGLNEVCGLEDLFEDLRLFEGSRVAIWIFGDIEG